MSIGSGQSHDRDGALTPEERALADRLARLGPQGEPSPALDARILSAARAADGASRASPAAPVHRPLRRRQRRWPVAFGAAATLVIVGGLAWQLRPVDELQVDYSEAPRAAPGPSADAAPRQMQQVARMAQPAAGTAPVAADSAASAPAVPAMEQAAADAGRAAEARSKARAQPEAFASGPPAPEEPPVVFDEPSPMDTPAPPAELRRMAPPPPPPAPAPPSARGDGFPPQPVVGGAPARPAVEDQAHAQRAKASEAAARRAPTAQVASGTTAQPARQADAAAAADASAVDHFEVDARAGDEDSGDQPLDDQPPASVDSPQVRQAWLQRVRQLIAEGRPDAARDSLREYQRRYPKAPLPDDLRALLAQ
jgi:resuscitation-promoting factor RpfA